MKDNIISKWLFKYGNEIIMEKECVKNGIKKEGESCSLNNNCIYPKCMKNIHLIPTDG
jgi:hypothetical protein